MGLVVNREKTKYIVMDKRNGPAASAINIELGFEKGTEFKYIGSVITENNELNPEIKARLAAANRAYFSMLKLFKSTLLSRTLKLYKTIIRPIVTYAAETWTTSQKEEKMLITFERKIYGPVRDGDVWRIRSNLELRNLYKEKDIIDMVKTKRLQWLGHLERMREAQRKFIKQNQREGEKLDVLGRDGWTR